MGLDDRAAHDPEAFRRLGHALIDQLADHLRAAQAGELAALPWTDPEAMAERWPADFAGGADPLAILRRVLDESIHQHNPRCMGHQVAVPFPGAALFDLVGAVLNNGMAAYESGPVSTAMERNVTRWLAERLGFGAEADGFLTSGGTLGMLTALLCARQARAGFDVWEEGSAGGPPLALLCSEHCHYAATRAVQVMGWGKKGVFAVPVDEAYRMRATAVERALREARAAGRRVVAVVATAGSSPVGAFDPLGELANLCQNENLWLHVDGAHGASVALSERYRHLLGGVERADSVVWDAHKLLGMPALSTAVLFRDGRRSYEAFSQQAEYLFYGDDRPWHDLALRNLECTKRMMSLTLYAALQVIGPDAIGAYVTRQIDLARRFAELVRGHADFELAVAPEANIVCFRHRGSDELQESLRRAVVREGSFYLTRTKLAGRTFLRVTLMNPHTGESDLRALLEALRAAA